MELDALDRELLERLQSDFPMTVRPFETLGRALGLEEQEVLARVRRLRQENVIRQIGAIFDTRRLGYQSTLVAFHVAEVSLEAVAAQISAHPGVSHNYARPHHYNLWFTLAVPPGMDVSAEIDRLAGQTGTSDYLNLPSTRMFKLRTHFRLGKNAAPPLNSAATPKGRTAKTSTASRAFSPADIPFVQALQQDLPIVAHPFADLATPLNLSEERLLDVARELNEAGIMRRFGAVLRHRRVGYKANGMGCWVVPEERIEAAGLRAAEFPQVSHCYQRPAYPPRWPYALFTMVHGQTKEEVEAVVAQIAQATGLDEYEVLYSTREFKKERVRYFVEPYPAG